MTDLGYEEIFSLDLNGNGITGKDNGDATFSITGTKAAGEVLSITEDSADPDGNGTGSVSYSWESSSDGNTGWTPISGAANESYTLTSTEEGKSIKAIVSYTCLLYTSPSPRDGSISRMPSSA